MLLWNLDLLFDHPATFLQLITSISIAMLIALTLHEYGHAYMANRLGDPTPKALGRLSLNPLRHLDPFGTVMIFLAGFGWGRPVPVDARYLRGDPRKSMAVVAFAGPLTNLIIAAVFGILIRAGVVAWESPLYLTVHGWEFGLMAADMVGWIVFINLMLAVFNLIPIAPLDGSKIAMGVLPSGQAVVLARMERHGPMILMGLIFFGWVTGYLWVFLRSAVNGLALLFVGSGV